MRTSKKSLLYITLIIFTFCLTCGFANHKNSKITVSQEYSNPIDAYYLPLIKNAGCEAERRELQDDYRGVWKTEFENVMAWMQNKCVYQEDKDNLLLYQKSVDSLLDAANPVLITASLDDYNLPPDSAERNIWGTGTRSGINEKRGELYRAASMNLIDSTYVFLDRDYSLEHYE